MQNILIKKRNIEIYPWFICGIGMLFYFYNFFLRVSPSVMHEELCASLKLSAYQFGHLSAFYYYAYTLMQLPAGILYDKFGVRFVQFFAVLISVLGLNIFISAHSYGYACLGRFLIGLGCSFAYIGVLKLASNWLAPNKFALATGLTTMFGMSAAIFSDLFLTKSLQRVGYQNALFIGILMGILLSIIILFFLRNNPKKVITTQAPLNVKELLTGLKYIVTNEQMWLIGIISCLTYLPSSVFLDLWGIPYLKNVYSFTPDEAARIASMAFMGCIVGAPLFGALSDKIKRRLKPLIISYMFIVILFCILLNSSSLSLMQIYVCFFLIGLFCGSHVLCFALSKENNDIRFAGISVAFCNCLTMVGGIVIQPLVGKILDWHHPSNLIEMPTKYCANDYFYALGIIPIGLILALGLSFFLKDTFFLKRKKIVFNN